MKVSNIKYISIRGSNKDVTTISKIENILTKDRFYKTLGYDNLFSFARRLKDYYVVTSHYVTKSDNLLSRGEAREVFKYIQQNNYELFKMFYECTYVEFKGGKFQNDSKRN